MGKSFPWRPFLRRWSTELMRTDLASRLDPPPESPDWLGFDPATAADVEALEARLGVLLPPSYTSFLLTSNGWRRTTHSIGRVRPAAEVNWFRVENEQWAEVYGDSGSDLEDDEYYAYGTHGAPDHRAAHMASLLQVSDVEDGVYVLNPEAVTPDGEWEAWLFANWVPGAIRYPSFAHLMLRQYRTFARAYDIKPATRGLPQPRTPPPEVPRVPAERVRKSQAKAPSLEALIVQMRTSEDPRARARAVRTFFGKLRGRPHATRRPDLVPLLVETFYAASDPDVRSACVAALTELAHEDDDAPKPLFDALSDGHPSVVLQGIFALGYFPDPRALEPLCRFIESRANVLYNENAMGALGELGDEGAVPTLAGVLTDTANRFDQNFATAAQALARCGEAGFAALEGALDHADPRVRWAAVIGLDVTGDPRATPLLDRMEQDPDEKVAGRAKMRMGKPYWET